MSGKARERESDEKVCKGKVCGGADRGKSEGKTGNMQGQTKGGEQIYNGKQNAERVWQGTDRGRKTEKYNVTEVGRRRDEQGATKERKGAEFLKDLHLRAGFGIMER